MKKIYCSFLTIILIAAKANAQDFIADSIKSVIANTKSDSIKASVLFELAGHEMGLQNFDTAVIVLNSTLTLATHKGFAEQEVESLSLLGVNYFYISHDINKGNQLTLQAISLARQHQLKAKEVDLLLDLSNRIGNKTDSIKLLMQQALSLSVQYNLVEQQINALTRKGNFYVANKPDSAKSYFFQALSLARQSHLPKSEVNLLQTMANTYSQNHWGDSAKYFMQEALRVARENHLADLEINLLNALINAQSPHFLKDSLNIL